MPPREPYPLDEAESRQRQALFKQWKEETTRDGKTVLPLVVPMLAPQMRNRPCSGRPGVPESARVWNVQEQQDPQPLPVGTPLSSEGPAAFNNFQGYCFRKSVLVILINEPAFVNWLMRHQVGMCLKDKECLICAFKNLAQQYHRPSARTAALHGSLDVFWDICEKSFWGFPSKRKVPLGMTESWSCNSHLGFLFHLLDALLENVQHLPVEVQHYQRLFYTEAMKVRTCRNCGAIDEGGTDAWFRRCFDIKKATLAARKMEDEIEDVLHLASSYTVTGLSCLHCSGELIDHMKIINPAELVFLTLPATSLNESDAKIHPFIPMQPELKMQSDSPRYFLQAAAISHLCHTSLLVSEPATASYIRSTTEVHSGSSPGSTMSVLNGVFACKVEYSRNFWRGPSNRTLSITPPLKPAAVQKTGPGESPPKRRHAPERKDGRSTRTSTGPANADAVAPVREVSSDDPATTHPQVSPELTAEFNNISVDDKNASVHQEKVIKAAFPKLTSEEASQLLAAYNGNLQEAVDGLKTHSSQQAMLLDDVPEEHQMEVLTAYLRFPGTPISEIFRVVRRHHPDHEKAYQELTDKPEINLGFAEHIGDSRFTTRICITPHTNYMTDSAPPKQQFPARQMVRGHAKLRTGKAIYAGSFEGELILEEFTGTRSHPEEEWQPLPLDPMPLLWNDYYARFKEYRFGETLSEAEKEAQKAREEQAIIERQVLDRFRELDQQLDSSLRWERSRARTQLRREDEQKERAVRDEVLQKMIQAELRSLFTPQPKQDPVLKKDLDSVQGKRRRSAQSDADDDGANDRARIRVLRAKHDGFAVKRLPAEKKTSEDLARVRAQLLANQVARARKGGSTMQASRVLKKREGKQEEKRKLRSSNVKTVAVDHQNVETSGNDDDDDNDNDKKVDGGWEIVTRRRRGNKGGMAASQSSTAGTGRRRSGDVAKQEYDDAVSRRRRSTRTKGSASTSSAETEEMYL